MRFLITGVCGPAGRALATQLTTRGHAVVGVDMLPNPGIGLDHFSTVPPVLSPYYFDELRRIARQHSVDVVVPTISEELEQLSSTQEKNSFAELGIEVLVSSQKSVVVSADKYKTMQQLELKDVSIPAFQRAEDRVSDWVLALGQEEQIIIKPKVSRGGRGVQLVTAEAFRKGCLKVDSNQIVQSFASGTEFSPMIFRNPRTQDIEVCVVVEKTELREGAVGNAVTVARRSHEEEMVRQIADIAHKAVLALDLVGPVDLDIRLDHTGRAQVLEVNSRFGANSESAPELVEAMLNYLEHSKQAEVILE